MAKNKGQKGSMSGWFRQHYRAHPDDLDKPNDVILGMWQAANPGIEIDDRVKNAMANVKTSVRKELGLIPKRKKKGRKAKAADGNGAAAAPVPEARGNLPKDVLEILEYDIDGCLMVARAYVEEDPDMEQVSKLLHRARNLIVILRGK